eukprot:12821-Pelagococcus_subviridis.AAC.1
MTATHRSSAFAASVASSEAIALAKISSRADAIAAATAARVVSWSDAWRRLTASSSDCTLARTTATSTSGAPADEDDGVAIAGAVVVGADAR